MKPYMDDLNINSMLGRESIFNDIVSYIKSFDYNSKNSLFRRGIYIYGKPGVGKTEFVLRLLKKCNINAIICDTTENRNKYIDVSNVNVSTKSICSLFSQVPRSNVLVLDEIELIQDEDKSFMKKIIKLIRPKTTKKQQSEGKLNMPVICVGINISDKKNCELSDVCKVFELKEPSPAQIKKLVYSTMPLLKEPDIGRIMKYVNSNLHKIASLQCIYSNGKMDKYTLDILLNDTVQNGQKDVKQVVKNVFNSSFNISHHSQMINEPDRNVVSLIWHENVIDLLSVRNDEELKNSLRVYAQILKNICFADCVNRVTFQCQIWSFNELCSLIKTFYCNNILREFGCIKKHCTDIRFTKILTKYSYEYNNCMFINDMCNILTMDKKDMILLFSTLQKNTDSDAYDILTKYDISALNIRRINKYINNFEDCEEV